MLEMIRGKEVVSAKTVGKKYPNCHYILTDVNDDLCDLKGKYRVDRFDIGDIHLGEQDIWITFDQNASDSILGMDMLRQVTFLQIENTGKLIFFQNVYELVRFIQGKN